MYVCTIIAKNYLAHARVLAKSFQEHHPAESDRFHVLVVDDFNGYIDPAQEPFEILRPEDLELDVESFERMAVLYNVLELSTALKPWLLQRLRRDGDGAAVYLDPDLRLYAPLDKMFALVREHGLVLSPHNIEPMPRDGKRPNEQDILIAGTYNLGFIGIGSGDIADAILDWWSERLREDCIVDPARGYFVDQRWMDFVPGMVERFHLLRDAGFNVAYWNLATRPVSHRDGTWFVNNDVPLRLFHFSGFDPERPHLLSKHQDRILLGDRPELADLCARYASELLAEGAAEVRNWPYSHDETSSGIKLDPALRAVFRHMVLDGHEGSPLTREGEVALIAAATEPAPLGGEHGLTRYVHEVWLRRPDLQHAYPRIDGSDVEGLLGWMRVHGTRERHIDEALLPLPTSPGTPHAGSGVIPTEARSTPLFGVNVAGYLRSESGVGEAARQVISALDANGVPLLPVALPAPAYRQEHAFAADSTIPDEPFGINLIYVNADMLPTFAADAGPSLFEGRYTIGWWWWEVQDFPSQYHGAFEHVDEVWVGSRFVADLLAAASPVPVVHMPFPVTLAAKPIPDKAAAGLPDGFVFLLVYDFNSVFERKNPTGALEAFVKAFPDPGQNVHLVLKSVNADAHLDHHERLRVMAAEHPHVHLRDGYVSAAEKDRMIASCDCYVSLHRSEGFGITLAEAMLMERPVIATGYSGNLDFMTHRNSWLVDYQLVKVGTRAWPYPPDCEWAEPDLEQAARHMRDVFEDRGTARERARRGAEDIAGRHSPGACGSVMRRRLETVASAHPSPVPPDVAGQARAQAALAAGLNDGRSTALGGSRLAKPRQVARKLVLRAIKPYTAQQARINLELAASAMNVGEAVERVARSARRRARADAATQAELRRAGTLAARLEHDAAMTQAVDRRVDDLAARMDKTAAGIDAVNARADDVSSQFDSLRVKVDQHDLLLGTGQEQVDDDTADYPEAPEQPWSEEYNDAHRRFVARELDDTELIATVGSGRPLPPRFGRRFDERVVEFPWTASRGLRGHVLDAGSTLNHFHVLKRLRPQMEALHIVTLAPEERSFPHLGASYIYADLRDMPVKDATYDEVVSISTLEHVGLDNTYYGAPATQPTGQPQEEALKAAHELWRVLRPGGSAHITVPFGRGERFSWVRTFAPAELDELIAVLEGGDPDVSYFRQTPEGWERSQREALSDARYRDHFTSGPVGADGVVAAEAVACVTVRKPSR